MQFENKNQMIFSAASTSLHEQHFPLAIRSRNFSLTMVRVYFFASKPTTNVLCSQNIDKSTDPIHQNRHVKNVYSSTYEKNESLAYGK